MSNAAEPKPSVCIIGVGAMTAVGLTARATAAAVRAGISGFNEHPFMVDRQGEPMIVARLPGLDDGSDTLTRQIAAIVRAAREALSPLHAYRNRIGAIPLFLALPPQRPGRPAHLENVLSDSLRSEIGVASVECLATGHAAGLMALEASCKKVSDCSSDFCLIGGVDSYLEPDTLTWLEANDQLHCGDNAYGFTPGEAAGFCLVCTQPTAERWKLRALAHVRTVGTARERNLIKTDSVCLGKGLTEAFRKVFAELSSSEGKIEHSVNDMNGEPYRADEYGFTVARLSERFANASAFVAPADCWGDVGAASGPLFVSLVVAAGQRGYSACKRNLLWASSESGERSAAILQNQALSNK